jgi:hypothetical protein
MASITNVDDIESQGEPIRRTTSKALKEELIDVLEHDQGEHKRKALEAIATAPDQPAKKNKRVRLRLDSGRVLLTLT